MKLVPPYIFLKALSCHEQVIVITYKVPTVSLNIARVALGRVTLPDTRISSTVDSDNMSYCHTCSRVFDKGLGNCSKASRLVRS